MQAWKESVDGEGFPNSGSLNPVLYGMRRSCDACGRKKRKCDGERPSCRRCLRAGEECVYSKRMCHLPMSQQDSTSGAVMEHGGMLPFKRCGLSASPATGLVGMQENNFLTDFFGCVGFMPLTTQSQIRETMVNIMLAPAVRHQAAFSADCDEAWQPNDNSLGGEVGSTCGWKELPTGPSTCVFWCAVALGALVKGSPVESVASYSQLAADALERGHSGPADAEVAKAWTILAYLHGFMGGMAKYQEYLALSETFLTTCIEQGSADMLPVGLAEAIQDRDNQTPCFATAYYAYFSQVPQLTRGASEPELYRYVMRSFHFFEKAAYAKITEEIAAEKETSGGTEPGTAPQPHQHGVPQPVDVSDAIASMWIEAKMVQLGALEEAVDRSSIGGGIGGILVNGFLGFQAAGKGDAATALKRFGRCVEIFARYPGLSRSVLGEHEAHAVLAALAALDDSRAREMYDTLRAACNPFRSPGTPPVPPLEEWRGLSSICSHLYCWSFAGIIASDKMRAFSNRPHSGTELDEEHGASSDVDEVHVGDGKLVGECAGPPETPLTMPAGLDEEAALGIDHDVTSADWLEVTHAMLDAGNEPGQPSSR